MRDGWRRKGATRAQLKSKRRRARILAVMAAAACAAAAAPPAAKLAAEYRSWRIETKTDSVDIPLEGLPATVTVSITYDAEEPKDIMLLDPVTGAPIASSQQESAGTISISADLPQDFGEAVTMSLRPGLNKKLDYGVTIGPSKSHIRLEACLIKDGSGGLWVSGHASAPFAEQHGEAVTLSVSLYGKRREPVLWEGELPKDGAFLVDVSDLLDSRRTGLFAGERILVSCTAMESGGVPAMSAQASLDPGDARDALPGELPRTGDGKDMNGSDMPGDRSNGASDDTDRIDNGTADTGNDS